MAYGQNRLPAVKTDGLAEQQPRDHRGEQHQVTLVRKRAALTQAAEAFRMKAGTGHRWVLAWIENRQHLMAPYRPNHLRLIL